MNIISAMYECLRKVRSKWLKGKPEKGEALGIYDIAVRMEWSEVEWEGEGAEEPSSAQVSINARPYKRIQENK